MKNNKKKFAISRWIFLFLAVISNSFIIVFSSLSRKDSDKLNNWLTNIFTSFINTITEKEVKQVPLTNLQLSMSEDTYNNIPGYELTEIPLGSAKEIYFTYLPDNATDKAVDYYTNNTDIVTLNKSGDKVSVVGMKVGTATIYGKNKSTGLISSININVVDTVAPTDFDVTLSKETVGIGSQSTINFDIDGGVLGHNELINSRYYDTRKLTYTSNNETIATVDKYGVIKPISTGETIITVTNQINSFSKSLPITVTSGVIPSNYTDLHIEGSNVCYGNDMISDQSSHKNNYPLSIYDGDTLLDPEDFIWESSNELLLNVDRHGVIRGFRKSTYEDESATITAVSKLTGQSVTFEVTIKEQLPIKMYFYYQNGDKVAWNREEYTACVGDIIQLNVGYEPNINKKDISVISSNDDVAEITMLGPKLSIRLLKEGSVKLTITSLVNPNLSFETTIKILKAGAISSEDLDSVGLNLRKIIGHASMFLIAQVFTLITLYMFLHDKKKVIVAGISLCISLLISIISEIIQSNIPNRSGNIIDVFINFMGAIVGFAFVALIYLITIKVKRNKKRQE